MEQDFSIEPSALTKAQKMFSYNVLLMSLGLI